MEVSILTKDNIFEAQKLLYEVYVLEQNWLIPENPSQLRVETDRLCDAYDSIATWFGIFDGETLVGCHRVCNRLHGYFELEQYHHLPDFIKYSDSAFEGNRLAIKKQYRSSQAFPELIRFVWTYLLEQHHCEFFFTTSSFPRPGIMYSRKFGLIKYGDPFRYHMEDPEEVYLFFANQEVLSQFCQSK